MCKCVLFSVYCTILLLARILLRQLRSNYIISSNYPHRSPRSHSSPFRRDCANAMSASCLTSSNVTRRQYDTNWGKISISYGLNLTTKKQAAAARSVCISRTTARHEMNLLHFGPFKKCIRWKLKPSADEI